jgi:hypothetical protein
MKKLLTILAILLSVVEIKGQFFESINQVSGVAFTKIYYNNYPNTQNGPLIYPQPTMGLTSGFNVSYLNHKYWNLNSQIMILQIGGQSQSELLDNNNNNVGTLTSDFYFNYLTFNTTFQIKYPFEFMCTSIKIGPRIDYLLWSTTSSATQYTSIPVSSFNNFNYGLDLGIALSKTFNEKFILSFESTYNMQFYNMANYQPYLYVKSLRSISVLIGFGYKFK